MVRLASTVREALSALALAAALVVAVPAGAAEIEGVRFADDVAVGETRLVLAGVGKLRWWMLTPYVGAFYVGEGVDPARWREDVPKRLELEYFYSIAGAKFGPAGEEVLARNVDRATLDGLRDRLRAIGALYVDVAPGDRYALTYLPGRGTELSKNGRALGTIPGADFAAAYLSIWLGEDPISGAFRDALLSP